MLQSKGRRRVPSFTGDSRKAAAKFIKDNPDSVVRVKDRVANPNGDGYRDILVNYRAPNGHITELQFNNREMLAAKNGKGHTLYEEWRVVKAAGGNNPTPVQQAHMRALENAQSDLYKQAYEKAGNGNGWKK